MQEIIKILMGLGQMRTATQSLTDDEVELIATELKREVTIKHLGEEDEAPEVFDDAEETLIARPPVVTIMGHVDHGKTTLLDAIRETSVAASEAGGITQHIGAYQVDHDGRKITFLDTPGHEAFTAMRARGANVTDVAVLVVAADDGVMPQTKESISHARAADVPIVVAINKIDLPDANTDRVKSELATDGLQPEEWGGTTQFSEVSAKQKTNLDDLLEKVLLVADVELDLRANPTAEASGPIVESRLDVGRGTVATMLVQRGTLRVGDAIVAGHAHGRVRGLFNYRGEKVKEAKPGEPVEILGFDTPPLAGEFAHVVENERQARHLAQMRDERLRREQFAARPRSVSLESLYEQMEDGDVQELGLVVKADVQGSVEAAVSEIAKIQHAEVRVLVIHSGVGGITESDVNLAAASGALIVGFNVRPEPRGPCTRRARRRRDPHLPRHLPAHGGHRAGPRRHAAAGQRGGRARRGRGARADQDLALRHDRRLVRDARRHPPRRPCPHRPRRRARLRDDDRLAAAVQGGHARGDRGLRVRHPPRGLRRRQGRRRRRGIRGAAGRANRARRVSADARLVAATPLIGSGEPFWTLAPLLCTPPL